MYNRKYNCNFIQLSTLASISSCSSPDACCGPSCLFNSDSFSASFWIFDLDTKLLLFYCGNSNFEIDGRSSSFSSLELSTCFVDFLYFFSVDTNYESSKNLTFSSFSISSLKNSSSYTSGSGGFFSVLVWICVNASPPILAMLLSRPCPWIYFTCFLIYLRKSLSLVNNFSVFVCSFKFIVVNL